MDVSVFCHIILYVLVVNSVSMEAETNQMKNEKCEGCRLDPQFACVDCPRVSDEEDFITFACY